MHQTREPRVVLAIFLAEAVSRVGDAVTFVALPLTAVLVLDAGPGGLALIAAAQSLPIVLLSIPAGAWVDRRTRRWPVLVSADLARAAALTAIPVAAAAGVLTIPLLAVLALVLSACGTFFDVAFAGWLPRLLRGDDLHRMNTRVELARSIAVSAGPGGAGVLVAAFSAPIALLADAASFVASAALIVVVRAGEPAATTSQSGRISRSELLEGVRFILATPLVRAVTATAAINNFTRSIAMAVAALYLVSAAGLSGAEFAFAFGIGNLGFVVGALACRTVSRRAGMGPTMLLGVALFGPSMLLFATVPVALAGGAFTAMLFAHGLGISLHNPNQVTVRQTLTPDLLRGRVAAVFRLMIFGALPLGSVVGGLVAQQFGLHAALTLSAAGLFLGSAPYVLIRVWRLRRVAELMAPAPVPEAGRGVG